MCGYVAGRVFVLRHCRRYIHSRDYGWSQVRMFKDTHTLCDVKNNNCKNWENMYSLTLKKSPHLVSSESDLLTHT